MRMKRSAPLPPLPQSRSRGDAPRLGAAPGCWEGGSAGSCCSTSPAIHLFHSSSPWKPLQLTSPMPAVLAERKRVNSCCNISEPDVLFSYSPQPKRTGESQSFPSLLKENLPFGYWVNSSPPRKAPWHLMPPLLYHTCMFSFGIYRGLNVISLLQIFTAHNCSNWSRKKITRTPCLTHQNFTSETFAAKMPARVIRSLFRRRVSSQNHQKSLRNVSIHNKISEKKKQNSREICSPTTANK